VNIHFLVLKLVIVAVCAYVGCCFS